MQDTDEIRLIEAQAAPTRFARGWHCLGLIRDFEDGKPHAINAFGQKLVVFRSGDGKINVLDSYCRHMGGDLSQGQVKGDEIACPFHDWRWGDDGRCKQVPYARRPPKLARTATWTTLEQDGMLFVWNDPEHNPPPPEVMIPTYLDSVVAGSAPRQRSTEFLTHVPGTVDMLRRTTALRFFWARDYSDYHPEEPGGSAAKRTCECHPFDTSLLGAYRTRLEPGLMEASVPVPTTGADYRWMNLVARVPRKGIPVFAKRIGQGVGGRLLGRRYAAGGQGLTAGLFAGVLRAGIPVWTDTALLRLRHDGDRVRGAVVRHGVRKVVITARRGVVLATGGFDHSMDMRWKFQSESLGANLSLGAAANTGDGIRAGQELGGGIDLMDQAWWFPAVAPLPDEAPAVMLAERSLPGSLIVDQHGRRFANESSDYMSFGQRLMSFGQRLLELERSGTPVESMWIIFDQQYRNSYVFGAQLFPRMRIPRAWYDAGIVVRADDFAELGARIGVPVADFTATITGFNQNAAAGVDPDFGRGRSAYDRYYGDPTIAPNPNLRALTKGPFYAVKMVLSDLGTCGGLRADHRARVLRENGAVIDGLYAIGNTAANAFGTTYPGAGATIAQGLVYGYIAARDAAGAH